jgi:hypothetical protein
MRLACKITSGEDESPTGSIIDDLLLVRPFVRGVCDEVVETLQRLTAKSPNISTTQICGNAVTSLIVQPA